MQFARFILCLTIFFAAQGCGGGSERAAKKDQARAEYAAQIAADQTPEKQATRQRLIAEMTARGLFESVEVPGKYPRVRVTSAFMTLPHKDKESAISCVYGYYCNPSLDTFFVTVVDNISGNDVGRFSGSDGGLKMF